MAVLIITDTNEFIKQLTAADMPVEQAEALCAQLRNNTAGLDHAAALLRTDLINTMYDMKLWIVVSQAIVTGLISMVVVLS